MDTGISHFSLKPKVYLTALKAAYSELVKLKPRLAAA
jgi:hypothetical protein